MITENLRRTSASRPIRRSQSSRNTAGKVVPAGTAALVRSSDSLRASEHYLFASVRTLSDRGTIVFAVDIPSFLRGVDHRRTLITCDDHGRLSRGPHVRSEATAKARSGVLRLQADCMQLAGVARSLTVTVTFRFHGAVLGHLGASGRVRMPARSPQS